MPCSANLVRLDWQVSNYRGRSKKVQRMRLTMLPHLLQPAFVGIVRSFDDVATHQTHYWLALLICVLYASGVHALVGLVVRTVLPASSPQVELDNRHKQAPAFVSAWHKLQPVRRSMCWYFHANRFELFLSACIIPNLMSWTICSNIIVQQNVSTACTSAKGFDS